jgi:hypothetical protein
MISVNQAHAAEGLADYNTSFQLDFLLYLTHWCVKEGSS